MTPQHHPGSGWLMDYVCGHLSPAFEIVIASHLLGCRICKEDLRLAEHVGAELMMAGAEMATILTAADIVNSTAKSPELDVWRAGSQLPGALDLTGLVSSYLRISLDALRWRGGAGGVSIAKLRHDDNDRCGCCARVPARCCRDTHTTVANLRWCSRGPTWWEIRSLG